MILWIWFYWKGNYSSCFYNDSFTHLSTFVTVQSVNKHVAKKISEKIWKIAITLPVNRSQLKLTDTSNFQVKKHKGNGGWGDRRDHALCRSFSVSTAPDSVMVNSSVLSTQVVGNSSVNGSAIVRSGSWSWYCNFLITDVYRVRFTMWWFFCIKERNIVVSEWGSY